MRPILFSIGPITIQSYGVMLALSLLLALFTTWRLYKNNFVFLRFRVTIDSFFDSALVFLLAFGIGARILHIIEHWDSFGRQPLLWVLFLHFPGFSFLGGVIGAVLGLWLFCKAAKLPFLQLLDIFAIGLSLALALSRIGSLLSGDSLGKEINGFRHPAQTYEAGLAFALFILLYILYKRGTLKAGETFVYFLFFTGISRFFVEMLRADSVYLAGFALAQIISGIFIVIAGSIIITTKHASVMAFTKGKIRLLKSRLGSSSRTSGSGGNGVGDSSSRSGVGDGQTGEVRD